MTAIKGESYLQGPTLSAARLASTVADNGASLIGIADVATVFTATTVEAALAEVKTLVDAGVALAKKSVHITHATFTDDVDGEVQTVNIDTALPANAVVLGHSIVVATPFTGGSVSSVLLDIGGTDIDAITAALELVTDQPTATEKKAAIGVMPQGAMSAQQLVATFTPDVGHDLEDLTAGDVTITVWYSILA